MQKDLIVTIMAKVTVRVELHAERFDCDLCGQGHSEGLTPCIEI